VAGERQQIAKSDSIHGFSQVMLAEGKVLNPFGLESANEPIRIAVRETAAHLHLFTGQRSAMQSPESPTMRSSAIGTQRRLSSVKTASSASLSVVVVSSGSALVAQGAAQALKGASREFVAQLIFVSPDTDPAFAAIVQRYGAEFVAAPEGSTRAEMCDLGMSRATGSIVAVRDDSAIGSAHWMDAYRAVLPCREVPARPVMTEAVVLDTLVASTVPLADSVATVTRPRPTSIELAAAV
jgi:hypothetical protein